MSDTPRISERGAELIDALMSFDLTQEDIDAADTYIARLEHVAEVARQVVAVGPADVNDAVHALAAALEGVEG